MSLYLGAPAPDFIAETTEGTISFHDWIGDDWCILFSHPKDFTPVCTTELGAVARLMPEFKRRGVRVIGLSVDTLAQHRAWSNDIVETQGIAPNYPLIADPELAIAKLYGMLPADAGTTAEGRTAADNRTARSVFVIGPDKTVELMITYPMTTGRDFNEILRAIDSLQLTRRHKVATPANWRQGEDVIIVPAVPDSVAQEMFPAGWNAPKPYLRLVKQPAA
ncbi:peroxiredoxin [Pseudoruegeria sp. HB172150]|uniref:peroxiredoxin n=1 Tax=Pseudoruegeria sp. HB172150 TaxID=2721164 RepID=UPI0015550BE3|nr:peroxiredoxin [Pseudoruegeria sp. HB172150]